MADNELEAIFEIGEEQEFDCLFSIDATTFDYEQLDKKPQINGETLIGNKTSEELHLASLQSLQDLDEKVDGINVNLTQQIDELEAKVDNQYQELTNDIDGVASALDFEIQAREMADTTINQRITDVADELNQTIEENVVALQQEDTALQNQINAHSTTLTAYDTRITNNANAISQEIIDRQNADDNLQEQIDGITASSDVKDIVGTYAELQAYDKSTLGDNDIIKVLQDETKENASTYYRYIASTQSFTYIGKEGPFYTKSETDTLLNAKQNVLISGTNIKTLNNESLLGEGNIDITSAQWGNITGTLANQTDLKNALDLKQNTTDNNLVTTAKTVVGAVNELDAKIKDIQLYKFPNAIIIGQPTINNGQISGFSQQNYLTLPFLFNVGDRAFELNYAFRTSDNVTTAQNLFGSNYCIASYIQNGKLNVRVSSNGTSWDVVSLETSLNVSANTVYYIKIAFNKLNYTISASTDGTTYNQIGYVVNTKKPIAGNVFIGIGNNQNNPFLGVINLNRWDIRLNNSIIWEGMDDVGLATRADISLSNLDEQGEAKLGTQVIIRSW